MVNDLRASRRGRRPCRARPLGRRPHHRARAAAAPSAPSSSAPPASCCCCTCEHGRAADSVEAAMRKAIATLPAELRRSITWDQGAEMANPRQLHHRHRHPDLLLRPPRALAARLEREHQRAPAPVPAQGHRPLEHSAADLARHPAQPQRPSPQDPRLPDTIRGLRTGRCVHRSEPASTRRTDCSIRSFPERSAAAVRRLAPDVGPDVVALEAGTASELVRRTLDWDDRRSWPETIRRQPVVCAVAVADGYRLTSVTRASS